jgi:hypothetical protein
MYLSQCLRGGLLQNDNSRISLWAATFSWWRGWAIYSQRATRPDMTEMTLGQWPTDTCHNGRISNTRDSFTWATSKADSTNSGRDFLSLSSLENIGMGWASRQYLTSITSTPLNSTVVTMTQEGRNKTTKRLRLRVSLSSDECLHIPPMASAVINVFERFWGSSSTAKPKLQGLLSVLTCELSQTH